VQVTDDVLASISSNRVRIRVRLDSRKLPLSQMTAQHNPSENHDTVLGRAMTKPSIRQVTSATFVSVLLGLVLKKLLDAFLPDGSLHNGVSDVLFAIWEKGLYSVVVTAQLMVFLFTLVRFYLGSFRYHEEELDVTSVVGAVGVFVSFYLASIVIKTTNLFYGAFALMTLIDLSWFWIAKKYHGLSEGMERVAELYIRFDIFSLIALIGFFVVEEYFGPRPFYFSQGVVLVILFIIGCIDMKLLWPFYSGLSGWQEKLKRKS
jgi:hypothetical protein